MDIRKHQKDGEKPDVFAEPTVFGGFFLVDHGEHYGLRPYEEVKLRNISEFLLRKLEIDGASAVAKADPKSPGLFRFTNGVVGEVSVTIPGNGSTTHQDVTELREFEPFQQ